MDNIDNNKKRTKPKIFKIIISTFLILVVFVGVFIYFQIGPYDKNSKKEIVVEIPSGSTTKNIADILYKNKLIKNKIVFEYNAKVSNKSTEFKAGKYKLSQSQTNNEIIDIIASGKVYNDGIKVTIPEGMTYKETIDILVDKKLGKKETYEKLINSPKDFYDEFEFLNQEDIVSLEGFLYPSTYYFDKKSSEKEVLSVFLNQFDKIYNNQIKEEMIKTKTDMTLQEVVNLASIVEKEAVLDDDRPVIASVFFNRLDIDMPLQSDATIQYAFDKRKEIVLYKDLEIDSPYNSYKNKGLPPTPIANPSIKSIEAVLNPSETDYLYFVAKMDGGNNYSKTYDEHLKYVKEYKEERDKLKKENVE